MEQFESGDRIWCVNTELIRSIDRDKTIKVGWEERYGSLEKTLAGVDLEAGFYVRAYDDRDHTLDFLYVDDEGNTRVSFYFYAERFTKNSFLHNFKQIIADGDI